MFFKKLYEIWTGKSLYSQMLDEFLEMLDLCTEMFAHIRDFYSGKKDPLKYKDKIFKADKTINRSERNIRKQIIEHLAVNPEEDMPACLILMSVVKDAERLGDYCKNMWEAVHYYGSPIAPDLEPACYRMLDELSEKINQVFRMTRESFRKSDSSLADDAIQLSNEITARCDGVIENLFAAEMPTKQAVALTLFSRYMKRIAAHLGNISSSVVMPFHKVDFPPHEHRKKDVADNSSDDETKNREAEQ